MTRGISVNGELKNGTLDLGAMKATSTLDYNKGYCVAI